MAAVSDARAMEAGGAGEASSPGRPNTDAEGAEVPGRPKKGAGKGSRSQERQREWREAEGARERRPQERQREREAEGKETENRPQERHRERWEMVGRKKWERWRM